MQACNGGEAEGTGHDPTSQEKSVSPDDIPTARLGYKGETALWTKTQLAYRIFNKVETIWLV